MLDDGSQVILKRPPEEELKEIVRFDCVRLTLQHEFTHNDPESSRSMPAPYSLCFDIALIGDDKVFCLFSATTQQPVNKTLTYRTKHPEQLFDKIAPASCAPLPNNLLMLFDEVCADANSRRIRSIPQKNDTPTKIPSLPPDLPDAQWSKSPDDESDPWFQLVAKSLGLTNYTATALDLN